MKLLPFEYAVRNLGRSPLRLLLGAGGSMLVVLLVLTAGAFVRGIEKGLAQRPPALFMTGWSCQF